MQSEQLIENLQSAFKSKRLYAVKKLAEKSERGERGDGSGITITFRSVYCGFDCYPSMLAYKAFKEGFGSVGLADYASLSGVKEFAKSCAIFKVPYYSGMGVKAEADGKKALLLALGVPAANVKRLHKSLAKARALKAKHVEKIRDAINEKFAKYRLYLPPTLKIFKKSKAASAETLYGALAQKISEKFTDENAVLKFLTEELGFSPTVADEEKLADKTSTLYASDLASILRNYLGFKDMKEKALPAKDIVATVKACGALPAMVYDGSAPDAFFAKVKKLGVKCVCFEPDKYALDARDFYDRAVENGVLPIARKVLDRPRKRVETQFDEELARLYEECALALCGHQISVDVNPDDGLFTEKTANALPDLKARVKLYSKIQK